MRSGGNNFENQPTKCMCTVVEKLGYEMVTMVQRGAAAARRRARVSSGEVCSSHLHNPQQLQLRQVLPSRPLGTVPRRLCSTSLLQSDESMLSAEAACVRDARTDRHG